MEGTHVDSKSPKSISRFFNSTYFSDKTIKKCTEVITIKVRRHLEEGLAVLG